jgi:MYXO-CTERM domain-containing protein
VGSEAVLTASEVGSRAGTFIIAPSLRCSSGDKVALTMVFGADDSAGSRVLTYAVSADGESWSVSPDNLELEGVAADDLGHWDLLTVGTGTNALWYSIEDGASGLKAIGLAASGADFSSPRSRTCTVSDGDTGDTGDTGGGETGDTAVDSGGDSGDSGVDSGVDDTGVAPGDTDTAAKGGDDTGTAGEGCACSTPGASAPAWLLIAGLAVLRRRSPR